jgi:hypothetical protein
MADYRADAVKAVYINMGQDLSVRVHDFVSPV